MAPLLSGRHTTRIPYSWLNEYLHTTKSPAELADILTMGGLEVEEVQTWTSPDGSVTDQVLCTKVTANRGDLLSLVGVARHAAALLRIASPPAVLPPLHAVERGAGGVRSSATVGPVTVQLADTEGCPRYTALLVEGVTVGPSPDWLANRLAAAGMRPISNVVDCTNYVLWELGQPLHAFDFDLLHDGTIIVRKAREGETIVTIDDQERQLLPTDLLITDPAGPVALAGIMGGSNSEVNAATTRVLLESAHFDPSTIRKTALRLGMSSEASYRFERHVDPNLTLVALWRVAELIVETSGGAIVPPALDVASREFAPLTIPLRPSRCNALLGTDLTADQMTAYLRSIEFGVEDAVAVPPPPSEGGGPGGVGSLSITIPTARPDIEREVDVIEEIAIIHGYNEIPTTIPGKLPASAVLTDSQRLERRARAILRGGGLNETLSFSMICPKDLDRCGFPADAPERNMLPLASPMIAEQSHMRTTLLPGLLAACEANVHQRISDVALYEINPVFLPLAGEELPHEEKRVAGVIMGNAWTSAWKSGGEMSPVDFYWMKGVVEQLLTGLNVGEVTFERGEHPTFAPGRCAAVRLSAVSPLYTSGEGGRGGEVAVLPPSPLVERGPGGEVGHLGEVAPSVQAAYDLPGRVYAFELNLEALLASACLLRAHAPLPRFPAALRDVALLVADDEAHAAARIAEAIRAAGGEYLRSVNAFDLYKDDQRLGAGKKSLAFSLEFRALDRTLTDDEVDAAMAAIVAHLQTAMAAEVRKA